MVANLPSSGGDAGEVIKNEEPAHTIDLGRDVQQRGGLQDRAGHVDHDNAGAARPVRARPRSAPLDDQ